MEFPVTERQARFMATADDLAVRFAERAERHDRDGSFPFENFADLHETGYLALSVPREYGGEEADPLEIALAQERLARGCGSTALMTTMHLALIGRLSVLRPWPESLFAEMCREVVANGALINTTNSEPDMGSPSRGGLPNTTLVRTSEGWALNGRKRWGSLAPGLTFFSILAAVDDGETPPRRGNVLLRAGAPGLRIEETWDNLGMRATASHDIVLEDVRLPAATPILPESPATPDSAGWNAFPSAAVWLGIAGAARDAAVKFARERRPSGMSGPIAELQTIQHRIAELELLLWQAHMALFTTARRWVEQPEARSGMDWELAAVKYVVTNNAIRITDLALRVTGSAGLSRSLPLERYFRDVRAGLGQPPMDDATLTLVGKTALGLTGKPAASRPEPVPAGAD
ncbi:MAG: acyl-CoA/acyl-ACP dehydrogenase [Thermomicrobiales bacterium]|nr:acyl-CoA/acyl-ACP dehydrogenase [Thermomicrobiales bacterium]